jgi:hypothetical protein
VAIRISTARIPPQASIASQETDMAQASSPAADSSATVEKPNLDPEGAGEEQNHGFLKSEDVSENPNHLKGLALVLVISCITVVTFLMLLDTSIVSTAIPVYSILPLRMFNLLTCRP